MAEGKNVFGEIHYSRKSSSLGIEFHVFNHTMAEKLSGTKRSNISIGSEVEIVQKHHQRSGELTEGFVQRLLTKSPNHPHGIKVQLETGEVGRVKFVLIKE